MPQFAVIIPAAGRSTRFGGNVGKLFLPLAGQPVLTRTVRIFARRRDVSQIVIAASDEAAVRKCVDRLEKSLRKKVGICPGGACRAESVRAGVNAVRPDIQWVAVHDAARPLVSRSVIDRTFAAAVAHGAAAAALPVHLTIKQAIGPLPAPVQRTIPRHQLWAMQTPQAMRRVDLLKAFADCPIPLKEITDDVQLLELHEKPVWLVEGDLRNIKITTPIDMRIAAQYLRK